jgi:hypothetical protein
MRGIFKNDEERERFNTISILIRDRVLDVMNFLLASENENNEKSGVLEKLAKMDTEKVNSLIKKAEKTATFLNKTKNFYYFTDQVKQININLLYGQEIGRQIRVSRNSNDYDGTGQYAKMHLDLYPFLFAVDAMELLGLIETKMGNYIHEVESGYQSRMFFSEEGKKLFNSFISSTRFEDIREKDLLVLTYIKTKIITKGENQGKLKKYITPIPYENTIKTRYKKKFIKQINSIYEKHKLTVNAENMTINNIINDKKKCRNELYKTN